jgi:phage-related protein
MANLQLAASDVVRETSYEDEDGSQRAIETFDRLFETGRSTIESKGPELARRIEEESDAVGGAVARGDLAGASREAKALQTAVNAAAAAVTGKAAGTEQGLIAVLEQMKAAARDLNEEAKNDDARGTKRAYEAFSKLFESSRKQLTAENPGAVETIETGLGKVRAALDGEDDAAAIQATTGDLLTATNALEGEAK